VTRKRLFIETMEKVLGGSNKVILESGGGQQGVLPYLPLPELQRRQNPPQQQGTSQQTGAATATGGSN
jgi:membrane protease subunit HflK